MFGVGRKIRAWGREFEDQLDKRLGKTGKNLAIVGALVWGVPPAVAALGPAARFLGEKISSMWSTKTVMDAATVAGAGASAKSPWGELASNVIAGAQFLNAGMAADAYINSKKAKKEAGEAAKEEAETVREDFAANQEAAEENIRRTMKLRGIDQEKFADQQKELKFKTAILIGEQRALFASGYVDINIGTPQLVQDAARLMMDKDLHKMHINAINSAWGYGTKIEDLTKDAATFARAAKSTNPEAAQRAAEARAGVYGHQKAMDVIESVMRMAGV